MMLYLQLFYEFFKTGLFAIGGGLATLPFLNDMADRLPWFTRETVADMLAVSESTPGPIGVNMATYTGFTMATKNFGMAYGPLGAIVATLGLITPSIVIILIIATILKKFRDNKYVNSAFYGLRPASTGLIASAGFSVLITCVLNTALYTQTGSILSLFKLDGIILGVILWVLMNNIEATKKLHPVVFIAISAVIGAVFKFGGA